MNIKIRKAKLEDSRRMAHVHRQSIRSVCRDWYSNEVIAAWSGGTSAAGVRRAIGNPNVNNIVAVVDGVICGVAASVKNRVWLLYLHPKWVGKGIGEKLLIRLERDMKRKGIRHGARAPETIQSVAMDLVDYTRMDASVIESDIHRPTDSSLIYDCVRVVDRALAAFRDANVTRAYPKTRAKDAKKIALRIVNAKDAKQRKAHYKNLLRSAKTLRDQMPRLVRKLERSDYDTVQGLARQLRDLRKVSELLPVIISQTERRIIKGESVPSSEKIVSIFEEHTDVIVKGQRETEFGHKVFGQKRPCA